MVTTAVDRHIIFNLEKTELLLFMND